MHLGDQLATAGGALPPQMPGRGLRGQKIRSGPLGSQLRGVGHVIFVAIAEIRSVGILLTKYCLNGVS